MEYELSKRKQKILKLLVGKYIQTAEPVASSDIKNMYGEDISSATIRSELASLEELGYLVQPHVSAGRIPTEQAYKLYVEGVLNDGEDMHLEVAGLKDYLNKKIVEIEDVIRSTAKVISDTTNYTSVIIMKNIGQVIIKDIKLVSLDDDSALVVIVTNSGVIKDNIIVIPTDMGNGYLEAANKLVNELFAGKTLSEIKLESRKMDEALAEYRVLFENIIKLLEDYAAGRSDKVFIEGTSKIFSHPEYSEMQNAKEFISLMDQKDKLSQLMDTGDDIELSVRIGKEDGINNCSMVTAKYSIGGREIGSAGVIGPERMDYNKVINVLRYVQKAFNEINDEKEDKNGRK